MKCHICLNLSHRIQKEVDTTELKYLQTPDPCILIADKSLPFNQYYLQSIKKAKLWHSYLCSWLEPQLRTKKFKDQIRQHSNYLWEGYVLTY